MPQPSIRRERLDREPPIDTDVRREPEADLPALMLPVRVETRFGGSRDRPELWVRVYPDQIAIDTHEPGFTSSEVRSTQQFWEALWRAGTADTEAARRAFEGLAQRYGGPRAAFLSQSAPLAPANAAHRPDAPTPGDAPLATEPVFTALPAELERPASWSRSPRARGLPPRWTVVLRRAGVPDRVVHGAPIPDELAMGPDPQSPPAPTPDGLAVDDGMRWMVDFDAAVDVGMALRIALDAADVAQGFDRVLAFGLRASTVAAPGPAALAQLLEAHRFTDGFDLVPQGAPTNNTTDATAPYSRRDPGFARAFGAMEAAAPAADRDGPLLERFLGLTAGTVGTAEHAAQADQLSGRHMLTALWPGTGGYFLAQMFSEVVPESAAREARAWVLARLRPRGAVPAIRVGDTPYGILPTGRLSHLPTRRGAVARRLTDLVGRLWPYWRAGAGAVPHVTRDGDPDEELVAILGMDASSRQYRVRYALGAEFTGHTMAWLGVGKGHEDLIHQPGRAALTNLGHADWDPHLVHLALAAHDRGVPFPTVDDAPVSDEHGLPAVALPDGTTGNYISWLASAPIADIRADAKAFPGGTPPSALLYKVLRHCVLLEWGRLAFHVLIDAQLVDASVLRERELVGFATAEPTPETAGVVGTRFAAHVPTVWEALDHPAPGAENPKLLVADHLTREVNAKTVFARPLSEIQESLEYLAGLSTAEIERLFTETLDTFSHRLDPWIGALLVDAIEERRDAAGTTDYHLGAFGWVEDLRAKPLQPPVLEGSLHRKVERVDAMRRELGSDARRPRPVREPAEDNAGFIHAPSLAQAATGAVLRNGYLAHRGSSDGQRLAIDLSSARVRRALEFLDGIREGQPLAALLGYRVERGLHRLNRDVLVQPLRDRFPLVANRLTEPAERAEAVAANNVVNGLDLHRTWRDGGLFNGTPPMNAAQRADVETLLRDLDDVLDAIGDLSIAESVFQMVRGNPSAAGGLLDAVSRGERAPEPEVVRTPRGGIDVTSRLVMLMSPGVTRSSDWGGAGNPRALAEPRLDAWVSIVLPKPGDVRCAVRFTDGGTATQTHITLAQLGLAPLDALDLSSAADHPAESELEQRILHRARRLHPSATDFELIFAPDASFGDDDRSFPEFLELARAVRELIAGARPLAPQDLLETDRVAASHGGAIHTGELAGRATGAISGLHADLSALQTASTADQLRAALMAAALYGGAGAIPIEPVGSNAAATARLDEQRQGVMRELQRRYDQAQAADAAFDSTHATEEALRDHLIGLLHTVFGRGFAVLATFAAPAAASFEAGLDDPGLLDGDPDAVERWLAQLAPVRAGVGRYDAVRTLSALAAGHRVSHLSVAQLPPVAGERWLARPFDPLAAPQAGHRVSIVADVLPAFDLAAPQCGLMLDEWVERIPADMQSTGLAFHYDQPTARAPQALLFAVCPDGTPTWDDAAIAAILDDTLELARVRGVDLETLPGLGQLLPALFFPFNAGGQTVSLDYYDIT